MHPDPLSDTVKLDDGRVASITHRLAVPMPDGWVSMIQREQLFAKKPILAFGQRGAHEPLIVFYSYGRTTEWDHLISKVATTKTALGKPQDRVFNGIPIKELTCTGDNGPMHLVLVLANGNGYGLEVWTANADEYETIVDRFVSRVDWNYEHKPRSIGEQIVVNVNERRRIAQNLGLRGWVQGYAIVGIGLLLLGKLRLFPGMSWWIVIGATLALSVLGVVAK